MEQQQQQRQESLERRTSTTGMYHAFGRQARLLFPPDFSLLTSGCSLCFY